MQASIFVPSQPPPQAPEAGGEHLMRLPCVSPTTDAHVPDFPATSQASHWPVHARLQQTPSTQNADPQSVGAPHAAPSAACAKTSAVESVTAPPLRNPPATSTRSPASSVAVCMLRSTPMLVTGAHVPVGGSKSSHAAVSVKAVLSLPVTRTRPLDRSAAAASWRRGVPNEPVVLHVPAAGS